MKTRFVIEIYSDSQLLPGVCEMVAAHNSGKCTLSIGDFQSYLKIQRCLYPTLHKGIESRLDVNTVTFSKNDEVLLSVQENEYLELKTEVNEKEI